MTTPKFMGFDEQDILKLKRKHAPNAFRSLNEVDSDLDYYHDMAAYDAIDIGAKHQHQRDLVVMKKLMEIVNMQENQILGFVMCLQEHGNNINPETLIQIYMKKLLQVQTMLKDLEETNKPND